MVNVLLSLWVEMVQIVRRARWKLVRLALLGMAQVMIVVETPVDVCARNSRRVQAGFEGGKNLQFRIWGHHQADSNLLRRAPAKPLRHSEWPSSPGLHT